MSEVLGAMQVIKRSQLMSMSMSVLTTAATKRLWRQASAVCFDVDSTVITEEGIDVLAEMCGAGPAVAEWTRKAMSGYVPFHMALERRLDLIKPSRMDVEKCLKAHPLELTEGMRELMQKLQRTKDVYLVSGGFRQMIHPVAEVLDIPLDRVFANNLLFHLDGSYKGFDKNEPTSRSGGKAEVIGNLIALKGYDPIIMVGDGATDLEARPPASAFVGFGGIVVRQAVKRGADWYAMDARELIDALEEED